jgi:hypothetical protein
MSDDDYETTQIHVEKPKRERTPAQKAATARALEALAAAREAKRAPPTPAPRPKPITTPRPAERVASSRPAPPPPARRETLYHEEEYEAPRPKASIKPSAPDYGEDIRALSEGLHGVISYIENKEQKKKKKVVLPPSDSEDSSSEEEEEVKPKPKRKTKPMKAAPASNSYNLNNVDPQDVLKSIFYRNH